MTAAKQKDTRILRIVEEVEFPVDESLVCLDSEEYETVVCGTKVYYREGIWCERYEDDWMPDWGLTWFYKDRKHPEDYLYYEKDPTETDLYKLRNIIEQR